jgi:hypothetical protein
MKKAFFMPCLLIGTTLLIGCSTFQSGTSSDSAIDLFNTKDLCREEAFVDGVKFIYSV